MSVVEKVEQVKSQLQSELDQLAGQIQLLNEVQSEHDSEVATVKAESYAEGKASVVLPDPNSTDLIFTQADMDKLAEVAKSEKEAEMQVKVDQANQATLDIQVQFNQQQIELDACKQSESELKAEIEADKVNDAEKAAQIQALAEQIK